MSIRHMEPEEFGPYTLVRRLATGGMGELFLAQRAGLAGFSKRLVVKRIRPELATDREFVEMFLGEGRIAALLDHPNVVHIYDLGEVNGIFYLAMEYIAGKDLGSLLLRNGGPLELSIAVYIMISLCEGVAFAHDATAPDGQPLALVHRDINPQNVLISYQGSVSITDFGIAKVRTCQNETRAGVLKGKFGYLAPEQAHSLPIDRRTDIYALGLLLFEVTTGTRAIPGRTDTELLYAAAEGVTQRPSELSRDYPRLLEKIYLRATAKRPEERYQNVRELQEALVKFQVEQRLVVTSSKLSDLMRRLFATEWTDERKLLTPTSARRPSSKVTGSGLHGQPTVLKGDGSVPKERSVREFVNAPTLHEAVVDLPPGEVDLGETVTDLPQYEGSDPGLQPAISAVQTNPRQGSAPAVVDPVLAAAQTRVLAKEDSDDERLLHGQWTHEDPAPPAQLATGPRWPIILISTLVTFIIGGGATYYLLVVRGGEKAITTVDPTDAAVAMTDSAPAADATIAVASPLDTSVPDAAPLARVIPDAAMPRSAPDAAAATVRPKEKKIEPRTGQLKLTSTPPVRVLWRGRDLGKTPVTAQLDPGKQRLVLMNGKLGIQVRREVTIRSGAVSRLAIEVKQGALLVKARPWAHVEVDGVRKGTTPMRPIQLYEGKHIVNLINTDKKKTHSEQVLIKPGETTKLVHRFE